MCISEKLLFFPSESRPGITFLSFYPVAWKLGMMLLKNKICFMLVNYILLRIALYFIVFAIFAFRSSKNTFDKVKPKKKKKNPECVSEELFFFPSESRPVFIPVSFWREKRHFFHPWALRHGRNYQVPYYFLIWYTIP